MTDSPNLKGQIVPQPEALNLLPAHIATAHSLIPMRVNSHQLVCAGPGPFDLDYLSQLQFQVQRHLTLVKVSEEAFREAFEKHYGTRVVPQANSFLDSICQPRPKLRAEGKSNPMEWASQPCRTTAVIGAIGGIGTTSIAANLAVLLGDQNQNVALLDANFSRPTCHIALGAKPTFTIRDLARNKTSAWSALTTSIAGVKLLAGEPGASDIAGIGYSDLASLGATPDQLANHFDHYIVDLPSQIDEPQLSFLARANKVIIVTNDDSTSLHNTLVMATAIHRADATANIHVLFNQVKDEKKAKKAFMRLRAHCDETNIHFAGILPASRQMDEAWACRTPLASLKPRDKHITALGKLQSQLLPNQFEVRTHHEAPQLAQTS